MRLQGRITEWKDDRGFGFITPNGGGAKIFLHLRSLQRGEARPAGGELVTYEVATVINKGPRAENVTYVDRPRKSDAPRRARSNLSATITVALLIASAAYAWQKYANRLDFFRTATHTDEPAAPSFASQPRSLAEQIAPGNFPSIFKCEGKTTCGQMSSCEEAKFYLRNCPNVKIDGDGDGIPCELQWCK